MSEVTGLAYDTFPPPPPLPGREAAAGSEVHSVVLDHLTDGSSFFTPLLTHPCGVMTAIKEVPHRITTADDNPCSIYPRAGMIPFAPPYLVVSFERLARLIVEEG